MTWTPEERAYVDAVASLACHGLAIDLRGQLQQRVIDARAALDAAQAAEPGEIVVTEEMVRAGRCALAESIFRPAAEYVTAIYRAMRAAEPKG